MGPELLGRASGGVHAGGRGRGRGRVCNPRPRRLAGVSELPCRDSRSCQDSSPSLSTCVFPNVGPRICCDSEHSRGGGTRLFPICAAFGLSLFYVYYSSLSF